MGMPKREWLAYYAREFNACEINSTFYAIPKPSSLEAMAEKTGDGFCCVDEPQLPNLLQPLAEATSRISYIRLHGRNSAKWWQHEHAYERYDYSYAPQELNEWLPRIRKLGGVTDRTFIFANNHWRAQAVGTIRQLSAMLD